MGLDLPDYLRDLGQEKFRAVILHTPAEVSRIMAKVIDISQAQRMGSHSLG